jgi:hypothetical protein
MTKKVCHPELVSGSLLKIYLLKMLKQVQHDGIIPSTQPGKGEGLRLRVKPAMTHHGCKSNPC